MATIVQTMKAIQGETFDSISLLLWGDKKYTGQLLAANPIIKESPGFHEADVLPKQVSLVKLVLSGPSPSGTTPGPPNF